MVEQGTAISAGGERNKDEW